MKYLGEQFDIHCGGIDHVPIHHTNEIAQSETATGIKPWVKYWMHGEFLLLDEGKMSKSGDNFITLQTLKTKNINPLAYRFFVLQAHYRKQLNFSWEALGSAEVGLKNLYNKALNTKNKDSRLDFASQKKIKDLFLEKINDDLDTAGVLALVWESLNNHEIDYETLLDFDKVLGLGFVDIVEEQEIEIATEIQTLLDARQKARDEKDYSKSDDLRDEIKKLGFEVEDTAGGQKIKKL
jgi:cysteinyl-tRNA synthetase